MEHRYFVFVCFTSAVLLMGVFVGILVTAIALGSMKYEEISGVILAESLIVGALSLNRAEEVHK